MAKEPVSYNRETRRLFINRNKRYVPCPGCACCFDQLTWPLYIQHPDSTEESGPCIDLPDIETCIQAAANGLYRALFPGIPPGEFPGVDELIAFLVQQFTGWHGCPEEAARDATTDEGGCCGGSKCMDPPFTGGLDSPCKCTRVGCDSFGSYAPGSDLCEPGGIFTPDSGFMGCIEVPCHRIGLPPEQNGVVPRIDTTETQGYCNGWIALQNNGLPEDRGIALGAAPPPDWDGDCDAISMLGWLLQNAPPEFGQLPNDLPEESGFELCPLTIRTPEPDSLREATCTICSEVSPSVTTLFANGCDLCAARDGCNQECPPCENCDDRHCFNITLTTLALSDLVCREYNTSRVMFASFEAIIFPTDPPTPLPEEPNHGPLGTNSCSHQGWNTDSQLPGQGCVLPSGAPMVSGWKIEEGEDGLDPCLCPDKVMMTRVTYSGFNLGVDVCRRSTTNPSDPTDLWCLHCGIASWSQGGGDDIFCAGGRGSHIDCEGGRDPLPDERCMERQCGAFLTVEAKIDSVTGRCGQLVDCDFEGPLCAYVVGQGFNLHVDHLIGHASIPEDPFFSPSEMECVECEMPISKDCSEGIAEQCGWSVQIHGVLRYSA